MIPDVTPEVLRTEAYKLEQVARRLREAATILDGQAPMHLSPRPEFYAPDHLKPGETPV